MSVITHATCLDCLIWHTICKHIHLLLRFLSVGKLPVIGDDEEMEAADSSHDFISQEMKVVPSHIYTKNKKTNDIELLKLTRDKLFTLAETIEPCTSLEALQQLDKQINAAQNLFSSMQRHAWHHKMEPIKKCSF